MLRKCQTVLIPAASETTTASERIQRSAVSRPSATGVAATAKTTAKVGKRSKMNHVAMKTLGMMQ